MITNPVGNTKQRGSMAGMTAVNIDGVQILKSKIGKRPKNSPMTYGQRRTQAVYATCMGAYAVLESLLKRTLLKDNPMQRANGLFLKYNMDSLEALVPKSRTGNDTILLCHYVVARGDGSLPPVATRMDGANCLTDISLGDTSITPETTLWQLSSALYTHNENYLIGDALTFVACTQQLGHEDHPPIFQLRYETLVLSDGKSPKSQLPIVSLLGHGLAASAPDGSGQQVLAMPVEDYRLVAVIHSRRLKDGRVTSSEQRLVGRNPLLDDYSSDQARDEAIRSYGPIKAADHFAPGTRVMTQGTLDDYFSH